MANKKDWNFSNKVQELLEQAYKLSLENGCKKVSNEHFLVVMIDSKDGIGYAVLNEQLPNNIKQLRKELYNSFSNQDKGKDLSENIEKVFYAQDLKVALQNAEKIASSIFGHEYICTEHILLAILHMQCKASVILNKFGISYDETKDKLQEIIATTHVSPPDTDGPAMAQVGRGAQKKNKVSFLDMFSTDLTDLAKKKKLHPIIGREKEIKRLIQVLGRKIKNNPVLLGQSGVGKTAVVEGLAQLMVSMNPPEWLKNKRLHLLDLGAIVAGTKYRGQFEERIKDLIKEVKNDESIILVIDEVHTINGAGSAEGSLDAANMLKQPLSRGEMRLIGLTTLEEYRKHIEKDKALERRFQTIIIAPPNKQETINILKGIKHIFEDHHNVYYSDEALEAAVKLSNRYITDRQMPDKAIDVIDEVGSRIKMRFDKSHILSKLEEKIKKTDEDIIGLIGEQNYEQANVLYEKRKIMLSELTQETEKANKIAHGKSAIVDKKNITEIVAMMTGIPLDKIECPNEKERLRTMKNELSKKVIGQGDAIDSVSKALIRGLQGIKEPNKPLGSFLFLGVTGTGKTHLAKVLASFLFNNEESFVVVDMSEFSEQHEASKFYGAPAGYIGHEESGVFERIRKNPYCVVLLDEIEKAHPKVLNALLQVLDEGRMTDSHQNVISFKNTIIVMTSNLGVAALKYKTLGFDISETDEQDYVCYKNKILEIAKKTLKQEFLNRLDEVIVFRKLSKEDCKNIVDVIIDDHNETFFKDKNLKISISCELKEKLAKDGFSEEYGGREIKRTIQKVVYDPLSEYLLGSNLDLDKEQIELTANINENGIVSFKILKEKLKQKEKVNC